MLGMTGTPAVTSGTASVMDALSHSAAVLSLYAHSKNGQSVHRFSCGNHENVLGYVLLHHTAVDLAILFAGWH